MIRVFTGGKYTASDYSNLAEIFRLGLEQVCDANSCDKCYAQKACKEVSQVITFCDKMRNKLLAHR